MRRCKMKRPKKRVKKLLTEKQIKAFRKEIKEMVNKIEPSAPGSIKMNLDEFFQIGNKK